MIKEILEKYWGFTSFRSIQEAIINEVLEKRDVLALMPTGGGKSITYQVPALAMDGICLVVSPLIALIKDQVEDLRKRGVEAEYIVSGMDYRDIDRILDKCIYGQSKFLYVSPERLKSRLFIERFKQMKIAFVAVDEAHCISQWGYDFRPAYTQISKLREFQSDLHFLALTASAIPEVVKDIQEQLTFKSPNVLHTSFKRENLHYIVIKEENKRERLLKGLELRKGSAIVYVRSRKLTRDLALYLEDNGISAAAYHAGLKPETKDLIQKTWKNDETRVMVATNAFGMGIDKANVRVVIHYDVPDSIEAYFQEAGRAGRDRMKAYAVLMYRDKDKEKLESSLELSFPPKELVFDIYEGIANHYQLAVGSGKNGSFDFDIVRIAEQLSIPPLHVYNAINILSREGYLHLSDSLHQPSKLKIKVSPSELYYFEVANPKFEHLLKTMLRSFQDLFESYSRFNEYQLAKRVQMDVKDLVNQLKYLDSIGLIDYLASNDRAQIVFLEERIARTNLSLSYTSYKALKERQEMRIEKMLEYIHSDGCRSRYLLEYFGEENTENCGKCDICLKRDNPVSEKELKAKLLGLFDGDKALNISFIRSQFKVQDEDELLRMMRHLMDEGILHREEELWKRRR